MSPIAHLWKLLPQQERPRKLGQGEVCTTCEGLNPFVSFKDNAEQGSVLAPGQTL